MGSSSRVAPEKLGHRSLLTYHSGFCSSVTMVSGARGGTDVRPLSLILSNSGASELQKEQMICD